MSLTSAKTAKPRWSFFRPSRIGAWLFVAPLLGIASFAAILFLTLDSFRSQESLLADIGSGAVERLENTSALGLELAETHTRMLELLGRAREAEAPAPLHEAALTRLAGLSRLEARLAQAPDRFVSADQDQGGFVHLVEVLRRYRAQAVSAVRLAADDSATALRALEAANESFRELLVARETLNGEALAQVRELTGAFEVRDAAMWRNLILVLAAATLLSLLISWATSSILSRGMLGVIRAMTGLARGDTEVDIQDLRRSDEIGDMARAAQAFADTLRRLRQEIGQREATEAALRGERNFISAINETVGALILVLDRSHRIVRFNLACETLTGFAPEEVIGTRPWDRLVAPEDCARVESRIVMLGQDCRRNDFEAVWITAEGKPLQIAWSNTTLLDSQGRIDHVICCGIDITEHLIAESRLRQAHTMQAVGQLAGGISHDFNNLLAVILIDLDLVTRRLEGDDHAKRMVEHAMAAGQRGAALTNRLLSFARQQPLRPEALRLDTLIGSMVGLFEGAIGEHIELSLRSDSDLWHCRIDPRQIVEALLSLSLNARDAMPDGGSLLFEANNASLSRAELPEDSGLEPGDYVALAVTDKGQGIPADILPRIFDPFFTTKPVGKGSGLGLSMVYGFMKQSRGHIDVHSTPGTGTTFRLYFPRSDPAADDADAGEARGETANFPSPAFAPGGRRILLVEDEADLRDLTFSLLENLGYSAVSAASGDDALAILEADGSFEVLFTDLALPGGMSGTALAGAAKKIDPGIKILYMSGNPEGYDLDDESLSDGRPMLAKPFRQSDLDRALRETLES